MKPDAKFYYFFGVLSVAFGLNKQQQAVGETFGLSIIHTNDIHAHFMEYDDGLV